ncbi:hypothetical protein CF326_g8143, partial [Tilletia indica]
MGDESLQLHRWWAAYSATLPTIVKDRIGELTASHRSGAELRLPALNFSSVLEAASYAVGACNRVVKVCDPIPFEDDSGDETVSDSSDSGSEAFNDEDDDSSTLTSIDSVEESEESDSSTLTSLDSADDRDERGRPYQHFSINTMWAFWVREAVAGDGVWRDGSTGWRVRAVTRPGDVPGEILKRLPTVQDPTTRLCWEELINDPTAHTWKALVEGKHASQQSTGQAAFRSSAPTSTNVSAALGPSKRLTARSLQATSASVTTRAPTQEVLDDFFDRSAARVAAAGRQSELWPGSDSFPGALPDDQMPYNSLWRGKHRFFNSDGSITSRSLAERLTLHTFNYAGLIRFLGFVLVLDPDWRP